MKKIYLTISLLCLFSMNSMADDPNGEPINFGVGGNGGGGTFDPTNGSDPIGRSPIVRPNVSIEDHVLYFNNSHPDYTLTLLDEDGFVAYQAFVPAGVSVVVLPATLSGEFELRLDFGSTYYFYAFIEL